MFLLKQYLPTVCLLISGSESNMNMWALSFNFRDCLYICKQLPTDEMNYDAFQQADFSTLGRYAAATVVVQACAAERAEFVKANVFGKDCSNLHSAWKYEDFRSIFMPFM